MRSSFRAWRRSRPFWAGMFAIAGGLEIMVLPLTPLASLVLLGVAGVPGLLLGLLMVVMGLFMWLSPVNRTLAGVLTLVFALASFLVSNLGGLIVGMVLGIIGGALCLAWGTGGPRHGRHAHDPATVPVPVVRPSPRPRSGGHSAFRRTGVVLGSVVAMLVGAGVTPAAAAPTDRCLLGLLCLPGGGPTTAPATSAPPIPTASPLLPLPGLLPDLPLPDLPLLPDPPVLPPVLPELPGVTELLPSGLITPVLPRVAAEPNLVVSGLVGTLTMDTLSVTNFRFLGVVRHPTPTGTIEALRIVVDSTDIGNLAVVAPGSQSSLLVEQVPGAPHASTGRLVLDIRRISLVAFGVLPLEFSFALPPPPLITLPVLSATDVKIDFVVLQASLTGPGLDVRVGSPSGGVGSGTGTAPPLASLVSFASLTKLPGLLVPYGFTPQQAATAVTRLRAPDVDGNSTVPRNRSADTVPWLRESVETVGLSPSRK